MRFTPLFAEREGFEPPVPLGTAVFKTAVIDHSTISPDATCAKELPNMMLFREVGIDLNRAPKCVSQT